MRWQFKQGHYYEEDYEYNLDIFCPNCGSEGLWSEVSSGDYYQGPTVVCTRCLSAGTQVLEFSPVKGEWGQTAEILRKYCDGR